ncbi:MAG: FlgO family outer membrane protein [Thermodesulfobacteriota bacterium]
MTRHCVLSALLLLLLAACSSAPRPVAPPPDPGAAFITENQAAAQTLALAAASRLEPGSRVLVATFADRDDLESASPLGRLLAEQVATVLSRAGYDLVEVRLRRDLGLRPAGGEFALSRHAELLALDNADAEAVLVGCYTADQDVVFVSARVVRTRDQVVAAAHDWALPNRGLAARLLAAGRESEAFERFLRPGAAMSAKPGQARTPVVEDLPGATKGVGSPFRLNP